MLSKQTFSLFIIMMIAFIDIMGVGLVYPMFGSMLYQADCKMLPETVSETTRGACLGILLAMMPLTQFFSSPILGMLSDQKGRKAILIPSLMIGVVGYLTAVIAVYFDHLILLVISRIAVGISAGTCSVVSAALADISLPENKAKNFGLLNMAFGLGFTVGPFLGGTLSKIALGGIIKDYSLPFVLAGTVTLINLALVTFFYKDSYVPKKTGKLSLIMGIKNIQKAFQSKGLRTVFLAVFLACVGWSFYWEFTPVTWITQYGFTTDTIGKFYAYGAAFYALCSGLLIRLVVNRFSNQNILFFAMLGCSFGIGMLLFHASDIWLWVYVPVQQFGMALFWPTASAVVSNSVGEDIQGETLGIMHSLDALAFAISPLIAGPLMGLSTSSPIIVGSVGMLIAAAVLRSRPTPILVTGKV